MLLTTNLNVVQLYYRSVADLCIPPLPPCNELLWHCIALALQWSRKQSWIGGTQVYLKDDPK